MLRWRLRRGFWNWLVVRKFRANTPQAIPVPTGPGRTVRTIPLQDRYPGIPITGILVAEHVPADENRRARLLFCKVQAFLYRVFPPGRRGCRR